MKRYFPKKNFTTQFIFIRIEKSQKNFLTISFVRIEKKNRNCKKIYLGGVNFFFWENCRYFDKISEKNIKKKKSRQRYKIFLGITSDFLAHGKINLGVPKKSVVHCEDRQSSIYLGFPLFSFVRKNKQTDRQTDKQTDRQTDKQTNIWRWIV